MLQWRICAKLLVLDGGVVQAEALRVPPLPNPIQRGISIRRRINNKKVVHNYKSLRASNKNCPFDECRLEGRRIDTEPINDGIVQWWRHDQEE